MAAILGQVDEQFVIRKYEDWVEITENSIND